MVYCCAIYGLRRFKDQGIHFQRQFRVLISIEDWKLKMAAIGHNWNFVVNALWVYEFKKKLICFNHFLILKSITDAFGSIVIFLKYWNIVFVNSRTRNSFSILFLIFSDLETQDGHRLLTRSTKEFIRQFFIGVTSFLKWEYPVLFLSESMKDTLSLSPMLRFKQNHSLYHNSGWQCKL